MPHLVAFIQRLHWHAMALRGQLKVVHVLGPEILLPIGCVNKRWKNCVIQPAAGMRTQFYHLLFTQPMGSNISGPSISMAMSIYLDKLDAPQSSVVKREMHLVFNESSNVNFVYILRPHQPNHEDFQIETRIRVHKLESFMQWYRIYVVCFQTVPYVSVAIWKSCVCRARGRRRGRTREHKTSPKAHRDIRYSDFDYQSTAEGCRSVCLLDRRTMYRALLKGRG